MRFGLVPGRLAVLGVRCELSISDEARLPLLTLAVFFRCRHILLATLREIHFGVIGVTNLHLGQLETVGHVRKPRLVSGHECVITVPERWCGERETWLSAV